MNYGILAAQLATSAAAIAANIFIPPPFGTIVATAISAITNISMAGVSLSQGDYITGTTALLSSAMSFIPTATLFSTAQKTFAKATGNLTRRTNDALMNIEKITRNINKKINSLSPDSLLNSAIKKISKNPKTSLLEDEQIILRKESELLNFGEVRTENKIFSTTFNKDNQSWIKSVTFEEKKFFNRYKIIGNLIITYYQNNDSRLGKRKYAENGNNEIVAVVFKGARYHNDYVSGFCRANSWGSYYMKNWMRGKPGRGIEGINTAIFFGNQWRVDAKLNALFRDYTNLDKVLMNFSEKTALEFIGKTKPGSYLFHYKDVFTKSVSKPLSEINSGKADFIAPYLKRKKATQKSLDSLIKKKGK